MFQYCIILGNETVCIEFLLVDGCFTSWMLGATLAALEKVSYRQ